MCLLGVGVIGAMGELSGPARQVTLPCAWHFRFSGSILSWRRLEFVYVCFSAWKTVSCTVTKNSNTPRHPLQLSSFCLLPFFLWEPEREDLVIFLCPFKSESHL